MIRPRLPNTDVILIGIASIADGFIAVLSLGFLLGSFRQRASLAAARRDYRRWSS